MDTQGCLVQETETALDAVGYSHSVGITDNGIPIVDESYYWNGSSWSQNSHNGLDVDNFPAILRWEEGRMLAYYDRLEISESSDLGNNWNLVASPSGSTGNAGTPDVIVPVTLPSHPSAKVWVKEQVIGGTNNYLTMFGEGSSRSPGKILLSAQYPSLPLNGSCTIRAFICDPKNARVTNATNAVTFSLQGSGGSLSASSVNAVNGMAVVTFNASGTDEVVKIRATGVNLQGDYIEIFVGKGVVRNDPVPVTGITVTGAGGATAIQTIGGTLQLSAAVTPANATNKAVTWTVQNGTGQATISANGLVTSVASGTVTASATAADGSGVKGSLVITIAEQPIKVTGITVTGAGGATTIQTIGGTLQLSAAVTPANATNKAVTWTVQNGTGQATISTNGLVTSVASGTVTASATAADGSGVKGSLVITIAEQPVKVTGITVTGAGGASTISSGGGTLPIVCHGIAIQCHQQNGNLVSPERYRGSDDQC